MNGRGRGKQPRKRSNMESYQNQAPSRAGTHCTHFTDQETENQKNSVTCPRLVASKSGLLGPQVSAQDYARTHASDGRWGGVLPGKASLWKPHSSAAHCPPTPVPGSARPPAGLRANSPALFTGGSSRGASGNEAGGPSPSRTSQPRCHRRAHWPSHTPTPREAWPQRRVTVEARGRQVGVQPQQCGVGV